MSDRELIVLASYGHPKFVELRKEQAVNRLSQKVGVSESDLHTKTSLALIQNKLDGSDCVAICVLLQSNSKIACSFPGTDLLFTGALKMLNLQGNKIGPDGGVAIGKALETNSKFPKCPCTDPFFIGALSELDLWGNSIGNAGGVAIGKALETNRVFLALSPK